MATPLTLKRIRRQSAVGSAITITTLGGIGGVGGWSRARRGQAPKRQCPRSVWSRDFGNTERGLAKPLPLGSLLQRRRLSLGWLRFKASASSARRP